ncbi:TonB-dependent siderophore receptor [Sphingobium sp. HBC34]|uniref:TonB-dependent siderophore receptor n=1 Tax=Sphingobium cyanobacteriorum TaxID=3063954 RepID=A0ABT8ZR97_9SPHN|nr:TonB-dependent siderophore receptor [Sphingobium sp. HBC34]MDO7837073.1 TonB-dependent siderophore receptor [Sphingobium sp. HBC34]
MFRRQAMLHVHVAAIGLMPILALAAPVAVSAQTQGLTLPAMPLSDALDRIQRQTGTQVNADPDAIRDLRSAPVDNARTAIAAVRQATRGMRLAIMESDGAISVVSEIVVVARRDEAETNVMVRGSTTSTRTGESLRDQPRSVQVISSKLLADQQAQSLPDALRNAGGVAVNTATVQGGVTYSVRGFSSGGSVNGLPTPSSSTFAAGSTQPIANIERLEVLKGPDAILLGGESLGGTVNIVTKKPSADERLYVSTETGSFGAGRITIDANRAITADGKLSGRVIAAAADADRNAGGYRGNEDYLFAPSIRFKNAHTDIIASITLGNQVFGMVPYTIFDANGVPLSVPRDKPIVGGRNQFAQIKSSIYDVQVKQEIAPWLTVAGHWQHQDSSLLIRQYSPFALWEPNRLVISRSGVNQHSVNNAIDGYARATFKTGPVEHKVVVGGMASDYDVVANQAIYPPSESGMFLYNFVTKQPTLGALASQYVFSNSVTGKQKSYYAQYVGKFWKLALMASVRRTNSDSTVVIPGRPTANYHSNGATTPSYGLVFNVTDDFSVYGALAYGFIPSFQTDRFLNLLPDNRTRNVEGGFKLDLFDKRVLINASYFNLRQSNLRVNDPVNRRFQIAIPGQVGKGIDVSVQGEPLKGWLISASLTRIDYSLLRPSLTTGTTVTMAPRDQFSLYTSYRHRIADDVSVGLGGGLYGRSSAVVDSFGRNSIPGNRQVDINAFMNLHKFDVNLGVRNLFDRVNYGITSTTSYVPLGEPRTWRLTVGYRFR